MQFFRPANFDSKIPPQLQRYTKENFIWQIQMTILVCAWMYFRDRRLDRKLDRKYPKSR